MQVYAPVDSHHSNHDDQCVTGCRYLAFFPLFFGGIFLGTLVVVGQGSKDGAMQMLTAVVLLSDVLFKVRHSRDLMQLVSKETHTN